MSSSPPSPDALTPARRPLRLAVVGAGPAGLTLALLAARSLPQARISLFDARPLERDVSADPRTLALSLGSVQLLQRLSAWHAAAAEPIVEVHISQAPPTLQHPLLGGEPVVSFSAAEQGVPQLGAVLSYGQLVAPLQTAWLAEAGQQPERLISRFGQPVVGLKALEHGEVEVDAGIAEPFDLVVVAEGGVFAGQAGKAPEQGRAAPSATAPSGGGGRLASRPGGAITHDYAQNAWVGTVSLDADSPPGVAYERFTRNGPLALLPLAPQQGAKRAALVWCMPKGEDEIAELSDAQRLAVIQTLLPARIGRLQGISALKCFPLGLNAERSLIDGRTVRIGNAAQTLHPVAGQGLNLGLRDAYALVQALKKVPDDLDQALRQVEWQRAPDRWSMIAATDFLARSFAWRWPGLPAARALGLAALQSLPPLKRALARQMMFGWR